MVLHQTKDEDRIALTVLQKDFLQNKGRMEHQDIETHGDSDLLDKAMLRYGHLPSSHRAAVASRSGMYFTGVPCKKGHFSPRYTANRVCAECQIDQMRRKRKEMPSKADRIQAAIRGGAAERLEFEIRSGAAKDLDAKLAAWLISVGAESIVPGLIRVKHELLVSRGWFHDALGEAIKCRRAYKSNTDNLVYFPLVMSSNLPTTKPQAMLWANGIDLLGESIFVLSVKAAITTSLMGETEFNSRRRTVLEGWLHRHSVTGVFEREVA